MKTEPNYRVKFSPRGRVVPLCLGWATGICPGRVARQMILASLRKRYGSKAGSKVAFEVTPTGAFLWKPP